MVRRRMDQRSGDEGLDTPGHVCVIVRRPLWARLALYATIALLVILLLGLIAVWIERRPIAKHFIEGELNRRGVQATYHLDRVGFRTQQVSNLVIGNPARPDLVAKFAEIQTRLKLNGNFEVYRIVARGVRLRGTLRRGRVSWGEIDKLMPPPSNKPFALPDFSLDVADSSIALATPFGPVGIALEGNGRLSGGFKGRIAVASPRLVPGRCAAINLRTNVEVAVVARRPRVEGPVTLDSLVCASSRFYVIEPSFDAKANFNESFTSVEGSGRMAISTLTAGANGLAAFIGNITYKGSLVHVDGHVQLAAERSRMATATADRTRLNGGYHLGIKDGTFELVGHFAADNSTLDPKTLDSITIPLASASGTPIGPVIASLGNAIGRTASQFDAQGQIRVVNFPGGGAARITSADIIGPGGARAHITGGSGVTYYWPAKRLRVDGAITMGGGGLPTGRVILNQPRADGPMSGVAQLSPYSAAGQRLSLSPVRFGPGPGGSTLISTLALLDGSFPGGQVRALSLPLEGRLGPGGAFAIGPKCTNISFNYLKAGTLQFGPTHLPVCPTGPAIVYKAVGGPVVASARLLNPALKGFLGKSPFQLSALSGAVTNKDFGLNSLELRLGKAASPIIVDAPHLSGRFEGANVSGTFSDTKAIIGKVPLLLSDADGRWLYRRSGLTIDSALTLSDKDPDPRFYPLRTSDAHLTINKDYARVTGSLHEPSSGTLVTNVSVENHFSDGSGEAILDVPSLAFGPKYQPDQLTRLTEGVVALVNGEIHGQGRIDWNKTGHVTSTGDFSTQNMSLAAPFGPVAGLTTTMHFTDLLGLTTAPHQVATIQSINPGIAVEDGTLNYQLLPHNLVKIERAEWPFMGGRLILHETVLNFGAPSAKRLTFELQGFDAKQFVDSLGFPGIELTGTFDGVLPMIFDENGGRIVGGRLDSRAPGGELKYDGTKPAGLAPGIAFDLLGDIRYRSMIVRLDGDLAGEFATKLTIDGVSLGQAHGTVAGIVHSVFSKLPLRLNLNINGPFRALIQMARAFKNPTEEIAPVMPFPIDSPALNVEVTNSTTTQQQTAKPDQKRQPIHPTPPAGGKP